MAVFFVTKDTKGSTLIYLRRKSCDIQREGRFSKKQYYQVAKKGQLQSSQLYFNSRFPLATALEKTNSLSELGKFVAEDEKEIYIPKSFRVKGNIFDKCDNSKMFEIQAILSKTDKEGLYDTVLYQEKDALHNLGEGIKKKIAI